MQETLEAKGVGGPEAWFPGCCELPAMGAQNQTQVLHWSNKVSLLLSHLSNSRFKLYNLQEQTSGMSTFSLQAISTEEPIFFFSI